MESRSIFSAQNSIQQSTPLKNRVWRATKKEGTLKCPFRGEADDRAGCPPFFLFVIMGGPKAMSTPWRSWF
jgi:hypothetical protein